LMNLKGGVESIDDIMARGMRELSPREFQAAWESLEALVLDTRGKDVFAAMHIPGSVFIGLDDNFAPWAGTLITDLKQPILFLADEGKEEEVIVRLSRVGYDNPVGFLKGGIWAWKEAGFDTMVLEEIDAETFAALYDSGTEEINLLDARRKSEYEAEHLVGAENFPLDFINQNMAQLDRNKKYYIHCAGGYRSVIMCSILQSRGFENLVNIRGGYKALSQTGLKKTKYTEPKTML
ncbi:MAG TPA: rhodanese-like domain-containing protein, partial [Chitinophagaceae bacterium]|nr:rhodanese-like domain-containing protein [Chitinophagaceae bacterium]